MWEALALLTKYVLPNAERWDSGEKVVECISFAGQLGALQKKGSTAKSPFVGTGESSMA
ncbi:MAG: hypothetical protein NTZ05_19330 [Chloroflexi bacterium]|nr:hypothetical protein [Chloroflexota bacterium]